MKGKIDSGTLKSIIIVILILVIVFGGSFFASEMKNEETGNTYNVDDTSLDTSTSTTALDAESESRSISSEEQKEHNQITVDEYIELKKESTPSVIYIARPTCSYCEIADPIIKHIAYLNDLTINYINTDEITDEESTDLINSDDYFSEGYGTPLLLIVKDNKIVDKVEGLTTTEEYTKFLKENGVIDE